MLFVTNLIQAVQYLNKETLEGYGDFKIGQQIIAMWNMQKTLYYWLRKKWYYSAWMMA